MRRMGVRDGVAQSGGAALSGAAQAEARLLVVEDDANILELLSASLRFAGFGVTTATSSQRRNSPVKDVHAVSCWPGGGA